MYAKQNALKLKKDIQKTGVGRLEAARQFAKELA